MPRRQNLRHLFLERSGTSERYSSPNANFAGKNFPSRLNRKDHASKLLSEISSFNREMRQPENSSSARGGNYVEVVGLPGFDLKTESMESKRKGVQLLNVRDLENNEKAATVFLPTASSNFFSQRVTEYKDKNSQRSKKGLPANNDLVRSIEIIRPVNILSFYTDDPELIPGDHTLNTWWEIWIRKSDENKAKYISFLERTQTTHNTKFLDFSDISVVLVNCSLNGLKHHIHECGFIAEFKKAKDISVEFYDMDNVGQREWSENLLQRLVPPNDDSPVICLLDTGVNKDHSLVQPALRVADFHSVIAGQDGYDRHGHGTAMAGLAIWGNIEQSLLNNHQVEIPARLESVKVRTNIPNDLKLYGNLTQEAVAKASINNPRNKRVVCIPLTYPPYSHRGAPSSWSAAIDDLAFGKVTGDQQLVVLAGGNVQQDPVDYPSQALTSTIHDPGQSWNALTVGYYANKDQITDAAFAGWTPLAPNGAIGPSSSTSLTWKRNKWPLKPDVVFDGGNFGRDPGGTNSDTPPSLQLLTLSNQFPHRHFNLTMETSAATALISRFAASIYKTYPNIWPEMVRALIVHSAEWTEEMKSLVNLANKTERESLLRIVGYGIPNLEQAEKSASNSLNLLIQDKISPFTVKGKMNELRLHKLPWPKDALEKLGELPVRMRVTLSYFIEPDPNTRGWDYKYRYSSYGFRFQVKRPGDSLKEFRARVNAASRDEDDDASYGGDYEEWYFGKNPRSKGSIHSDFWEGTAADLASREYLAVYPTSGWWKEKDIKQNEHRFARYALVVSISTPSEEHDIYTLVDNEIRILVDVET